MVNIEKKIFPEYFEAITAGKKKYELRLNDFKVNEGDTLILKEWDPNTQSYTGRSITKQITCVRSFKIDQLHWPEQEIKDKGLLIMSLD